MEKIPETKDTKDIIDKAEKMAETPISKIKRRIQPTVEGINSAKTSKDVIFVKPTLTDKEKLLISEPMNGFKLKEQSLMPKSVIDKINRKPGHAKEIVVSLLILLILGFGGYKGYQWYMAKTTANLDLEQQPKIQSSMNQPVEALPTLASSSVTGAPTSSPSELTATPAPVTVKTLKINATPTGYLNVRNTPSTSGTLITQVSPGEVYPYTATKNGWYNITLLGNQSGWVTGQYVTAQ